MNVKGSYLLVYSVAFRTITLSSLVTIPPHTKNRNSEMEAKSKLCPVCISMVALRDTSVNRATRVADGVCRKAAVSAASRKYDTCKAPHVRIDNLSSGIKQSNLLQYAINMLFKFEGKRDSCRISQLFYYLFNKAVFNSTLVL